MSQPIDDYRPSTREIVSTLIAAGVGAWGASWGFQMDDPVTGWIGVALAVLFPALLGARYALHFSHRRFQERMAVEWAELYCRVEAPADEDPR